MIQTVFEKEDIKDRLLKIVAIPDVFDDDKWLQLVKKRAGEFDVSIGNNEWTNGILAKAGIIILRVPFYKRSLYEGRKIRQLLKNRDKWEGRVPPYLILLIPS